MAFIFSDEELIAMAKEAKLTEPVLGDWMIDYGDAQDRIRMFADLIAAKVLEKISQANGPESGVDLSGRGS